MFFVGLVGGDVAPSCGAWSSEGQGSLAVFASSCPPGDSPTVAAAGS